MGSMAEDIPWAVEKWEQFLYFCCPEHLKAKQHFGNKDHSKDTFLQHVFEKHPEAREFLSLLGGIDIKTEIVDYLVKYDIPYNDSNQINISNNVEFIGLDTEITNSIIEVRRRTN